MDWYCAKDARAVHPLTMNAKEIIVVCNERVSSRCRREQLGLIPVPLALQFAGCHRTMTGSAKK